MLTCVIDTPLTSCSHSVGPSKYLENKHGAVRGILIILVRKDYN